MARIRTVKPDFFRHELLQDLEDKYPLQRVMLVFEGLWTLCDKNGVFKDSARHIKLDILPFVKFDMETTLNILAEAGFIIRYEVEPTRNQQGTDKEPLKKLLGTIRKRKRKGKRKSY